jgi:anti-sigma factor RsiW
MPYIFCSVGEAAIPHPDIATLLQYRDGELPSDGRLAIEAHLRECHSCRADFQHLRAAVTEPPRKTDAGLTASILDSVRSKLRGRESRRDQELSPEEVRKRVAGQVGRFLGCRGARKILEPVSPNNQDLLSVVEPVLGEFLGRSAAAALVDCVVETAIVKI